MLSAGAWRRLPLFTFQSAGLSYIWCSARRLSQIAAVLRNGLMVVGPWSWVRRWLTSPRFRFSVCVCVSKCTTPIWVVCPWGWRRVRRLSRLKDVLVVWWTDSGNGQWIAELTNVGIGISDETTFFGIPGCFCKPFGRRLSILTWVDNLSGVRTFSNHVALLTVLLHWRQKCKRYDMEMF